MSEFRQILVLDFDGVLHSYTSGWKGADVIPDPPVAGAAEFLEEVVEHFEVHVLSSRSHQEGGIRAMKEWCSLEFGHKIAEKLNFPREKPPAHLIIDDRAFCFEGEWPDVEEIKTFVPWTKRPGWDRPR